MGKNRVMFIVTALKIMTFCFAMILIILLCGAKTIEITDSTGLGVVAMMGIFVIGMIVYIYAYPTLFKEYKKHWDQLPPSKGGGLPRSKPQVD